MTSGAFSMGSDRRYPEEAPVHGVKVDPFRIERTPGTNAQFRRFVVATGYVRVAENPPDRKDSPGALPYMLKPGSLVFTSPVRVTDLRDWSQSDWSQRWRCQFGADGRHRSGLEPRLAQAMDDHPVVQIEYRDFEAYAAWAGKQLPTEAEWEFAARGGLNGAAFAWGEPGTLPVSAFLPNGYDVYDTIGDVWALTADGFSNHHTADQQKARCIPENPRGGAQADRDDARTPNISIRARW